jgi:hypothetical protein
VNDVNIVVMFHQKDFKSIEGEKNMVFESSSEIGILRHRHPLYTFIVIVVQVLLVSLLSLAFILSLEFRLLIEILMLLKFPLLPTFQQFKVFLLVLISLASSIMSMTE